MSFKSAALCCTTSHRTLFRYGLGGLAVLAFVAAVLAPAPARADGEEESPAEKTLESKGLEKAGTTWVLPEETTIRKGMVQLRRLNADFDRVQRQQKSFERKIAKVKGYIAQLQYQISEAEKAGRRAEDQKEFEKAEDLYEDLVRKVEQLSKEKAKREEKMAIKIDKAQGAYVEKLMEIATSSNEIRKKYKELSEDKEVTEALEKLSAETGRPHTLGPSRVFDRNMRLVDRWSKGIQAGEIDLRKDGNTLWIDVVINNQSRREMVVDTGADSVSLPHDFALELGIEATDDDEMVKLQMADGRIVDARKKMLSSVQVGKFIVHDVECVVLPRDLISATPLLGGSFLKNFTYHINPEHGKIRLSRTEGDVAETDVKDKSPSAGASVKETDEK